MHQKTSASVHMPECVWLLEGKLMGTASCPQQEVWFRWWQTSAAYQRQHGLMVTGLNIREEKTMGRFGKTAETLVCGMSCNVCVWPPEGGQTPIILLLRCCPHAERRLYLNCGISEEVTDVRNDFTERQALRSKSAKTKWTFVQNATT